MFDNFYGLTGKPFQLTPDPEFYFRSNTHRKALSYLGYGLAQGEGFIVITGEVGSGKSTLVAHMMESLDERQVTVAQIVTSKLDGEEIVHVVARSFGLDIEGHDKATALGADRELSARRSPRWPALPAGAWTNRRTLPSSALEELRMLSNFQLGNHPLLQTLLLGQPEFRVTHPERSGPGATAPARDRGASPGADAEGRDRALYLPSPARRWAGTAIPTFDQRVFSELYEASGGIPRRVNQIANRLLLLGAVEERNRIDAAMLQNVLGEMEAERAFPEAAPMPSHAGAWKRALSR